MPELGDGMGQVEALLYENIGSVITDLEIIVTETLDKPLLTKGFSNSSGLNKPLIVVSNINNHRTYSYSVGGSGSLYSYSFDTDELTESFDDFQPDDDFEVGVNGQLVNLSLSIPNFFFSVGFLNLEVENFFIETYSGTFSYALSPIKDIFLSNTIDWKPLTLQSGLTFGINKVGVEAEAGIITEEFELDPDGDGPLLGQSIIIELDPVVNISLDSYIGSFSLTGSSGFNFFDFISFNIGGGVSLFVGQTNIGVESSEDINIVGYLSELIEEPGVVKISGSVSGSSPDPFMAYALSSLQFNFSSTFINLNVLYNFSKGISAGVSFGVFY